jgi:hypothetical protein
MKLDRRQWKLHMFDRHNHAIFTFSGHSQIRRQRFAHGIEGVVTARSELGRKVSKDPATKHTYVRSFAVHRAQELSQFPAKMLHYSLQAQTDAEYWQFNRKGGRYCGGHAEIFRRARSRRKNDQVRLECSKLTERETRAQRYDISSGLPQVVCQCVYKRVLMVYE